MAAQAERLAEKFAAAGFEPVTVDMSELLKAGGGVKCATLELHAPVAGKRMGTDRLAETLRLHTRLHHPRTG